MSIKRGAAGGGGTPVKKVFISWSGEIGRHVALALKEVLFKRDEFEAFVSDVDIPAGSSWFEAIEEALDGAAIGIGCLTPGAASSQWFSFEAGYLYAKLNSFKILRFGEEVPTPLQNLQAFDGTNKDRLIQLFKEIMTFGATDAAAWINHNYPEWSERLKILKDPAYQFDIQISSIAKSIALLKSNDHYAKNLGYNRTIGKSIRDFHDQIRTATSIYCVPATQYPYYLISLQEELKDEGITVDAVALVDHDELFWHEDVGSKVLRTVNLASRRIFVFHSEKQLQRFWPRLEQHAGKYNVRAMDYARLAGEFPDYKKDFSVISVGDSMILAAYDHTQAVKSIVFDAREREVRQHAKVFEEIFARAVPVSSGVDQDEIRARVFEGYGMTQYNKKTVEMSRYIPVLEYDRNEERHEYYQDMMAEMEGIFAAHRGDPSAHQDVVEFGAGTGIFTRRLAKLAEISVTAVEIDWACHYLLEHNLRKFTNVAPIHADSRYYDPGGARKYRFVFSSFADHHINLADKRGYLANVRDNLADDGLYVVGDEFLPDHDPEDREDVERALKLYHNHIIECARQRAERAATPEDRMGYDALIKLESEALESGLEREGDFKCSCKHYEGQLRDAGLMFASTKIGPQGRDDLGGIYVYVAWKASRSRPLLSAKYS